MCNAEERDSGVEEETAHERRRVGRGVDKERQEGRTI